jgi:pilus assembly protein CpaE
VSSEPLLATVATAKPASLAPVPPAPAPTFAPVLTAMVYTRDRDAEGVIRQCLTNLLPSAEFISGTVVNAIKQLAQRSSPRLLIVDVTGSGDPVAQIRSLAEVCEPGTGVIVIGDSNDIRLYRELRWAGIVDYFFKPLVTTLVTQAASGILTGTVEQHASRTGRLVIVLGVRGGVGATTIATSAAWYMAEKRQRRVALLDLDLYAGDAALQLDAAPTHALCEALEHPERVDELFLERAIIHVTERLSLLSSLENLNSPMVLGEESVLSLLDKLLRAYRYVFVDLPAEMAYRLPRVLHIPGICLLVSGPSLVSARDVARWREIIGPGSAERQILHILNKNGAPGGLPSAEFLRAASQAPDITIPYDHNIAVASSLGVKGVLGCATLQHGLAPLFSLMAGEAEEAPHSLFNRTLNRLLRRA